MENIGKRMQKTFNEIKNFFIVDLGLEIIKSTDKAIGGIENLTKVMKVLVEFIKNLAIPAVGGLVFLMVRLTILTASNPMSRLLKFPPIVREEGSLRPGMGHVFRWGVQIFLRPPPHLVLPLP